MERARAIMKLGTGRQLRRVMKNLAAAMFMPVALLVLITPAVLLAFAYANTPDPSWIPGIYDDADFDDVVTLVTSASADVAPAVAVHARPAAMVVESLPQFVENTVVAPSRLAPPPRAPPTP
jgi:hypothetical protein